MKISKTQEHTYNDYIILFIEIATIFCLLIIAKYIHKIPLPNSTNISETQKNNNNNITLKKYYFFTILLLVIIIHNLVVKGWHSPKDFIFISILIVIGIWVNRQQYSTESFKNKDNEDNYKLQTLGQNEIDYNIPDPGRNNKSYTPALIGTNMHDAHPEINDSELIWGNRPEHYDFTPDDIPTYLELESIRKLKKLQNKVKRDKNYKYLAEIKPFDAQSINRAGCTDDTMQCQGLTLHMQHGLDNIFLEHADQHKAYAMAKDVLDALTDNPYCVWKEGDAKTKNIKGSGKYKRNNGVPGSWYKFIREPEPTLTPDQEIICTSPATTTTRPNDLKTSPDTGTGPVISLPEIRDDMIESSSKFRTSEYFNNNNIATVPTTILSDIPRIIIGADTDQYSLLSDAINMRLPGSSDKISQYATNYPLVSTQSLEKISNNTIGTLHAL